MKATWGRDIISSPARVQLLQKGLVVSLCIALELVMHRTLKGSPSRNRFMEFGSRGTGIG